jgi:DNA-binding MarR family transcriptional regulator
VKNSKSITKAQYETLAAFRFALRQFLRFSEDAAHDAGLTPQQHQALLAIKGYPGRDYVSISELAERLQIAHHSTVGLVDRLELEKLIVRKPAAEDRRRVWVTLSKRGEEILGLLTAAHREQLRRIGPDFAGMLQHLADPAAS